MDNNTVGTITAEHSEQIIEVFGEKGRKIAENLKKNPKTTMLAELFKNFAKK